MNYLGYRWWRVLEDKEGLHLRSVVQPWEWPIGGIAQAVHFNFVSGYPPEGHDLKLPHRAPLYNCTCGIYAYRSLGEAMTGINGLTYGDDRESEHRAFVIGAVVTGGKVVFHKEEGLRAEQARPVAFASWEHSTPHRLVREISSTLGVPLMTYGALERFCTEFGDRQPTP